MKTEQLYWVCCHAHDSLPDYRVVDITTDGALLVVDKSTGDAWVETLSKMLPRFKFYLVEC